MDSLTERFHTQLGRAVLPKLRWHASNWKYLLSLPFSAWGDFFALRRVKLKMMKAYANRNLVSKTPSFVGAYIRAVNKNQIMTLDYLQAYGEELLRLFVRRHFRRRYGLNSPQWHEFVEKEEGALMEVVERRAARQCLFLEKTIMGLDEFPYAARKKYVKEKRSVLKHSLDMYFREQDVKKLLGSSSATRAEIIKAIALMNNSGHQR